VPFVEGGTSSTATTYSAVCAFGDSTLENVQAMEAHGSPRTARLYDRTGDVITLDEVECIPIVIA
jgi:hypothetical protein